MTASHTADHCYITIEELQSVPIRQFSVSTNSSRDAFSIIEQIAQGGRLAPKEVSRSVISRFDSDDQAAYAQDYSALVAMSSQVSNSIDGDELNSVVSNVQQVRQRYALLSHAVALEDNVRRPSHDRIRQVLMSVDGLSSSLIINQLAVLAKATQERADALAEQSSEQSLRDSRLVALGTAFLVPSLWFAVLGMNVLPVSIYGYETASLPAVLIAMGTGGIGGVVSWYAIRKRYEGKPKRLTGKRNEDA